MNISGIVLRAHPAQHPALTQALLALPGLEIHGAGSDGRMVITLEDRDNNSAADTYVKLHDMPGVLSVSLIYQHSEDEPDAEMNNEETAS